MHARLLLLGDIVLGAVLLALTLGLGGVERSAVTLLLAAGPAVAAALARRYPAAALAVVWVVAAGQVASATFVSASWLALPFVAYRLARHGRRPTLWLAGLSIPVGAVTAVVVAGLEPETFRNVTALATLVRLSGRGVVGALLVLLAVNVAPFALGLVVRVSERSRRAEARAAAEHDLAQARAGETRLARDVHDVVGHSLAVIIAQADAARLSTDDDAARAALERIASVGRSSLGEVRDVLARTGDPSGDTITATPELDELVAGVRAAGNDVDDRVSGTSATVDDDTAAAAYRVLQEMLTNSLKHGSPGGTIEVDRVWTPDGLTLRVTNPVTATAPADDGMGLAGVRTRVAAVGGTFRTAVTTPNGSPARFVATAFLPVGPR